MQQHIKLDVWGGAGEHGRSCYFVQAGSCTLLLDCGGKKEDGGTYPLFVPEQVRNLQAVFLTHAHEDHMAALPLLLKHGFTGEVWLTKETYRQLPAYALAWASYVEGQGKQLPYAASDWQLLRYRFLDDETQHNNWLAITPEFRVCWGPSGHLPGAIWLLLELEGSIIFYSGDYSRESTLLQATMPDLLLLEGRPIALAIVDAAYGDSPYDQQHYVTELCEKLAAVYNRGGHALLPVPLIGRGLDLIVELNTRLPDVPVVAEASLIEEWEYQLGNDAAIWLQGDKLTLLKTALSRVQTIADDHQKRQQLIQGNPSLILSPDGMMLAEPAQSYGKMLQGEARHAIVFTGHLSEDVSLLANFECEIKRYRYKVHQGLPDVLAMLDMLNPQRTLLVHTGIEATQRLSQHLVEQGYSIANGYDL